MPRFDVIDINGKEYTDVSIDFANRNLLNQVKVLSVFGFVESEVGDDYNEDELDYNCGIFFGELTSFLSRTTKRIETIMIDSILDGIDQIPEYLTFLSSCFTIADSFNGHGCFWGEGPLACIKAGLCQTNGPKKIVFSLDDWTKCDALWLFPLIFGIGASSSLEHVEIHRITQSSA